MPETELTITWGCLRCPNCSELFGEDFCSDQRHLWSWHTSTPSCVHSFQTQGSPSFSRTPNLTLLVTVTLPISPESGDGVSESSTEQSQRSQQMKRPPYFLSRCCHKIPWVSHSNIGLFFKNFPSQAINFGSQCLEQTPISNRMNNLSHIQHSGRHCSGLKEGLLQIPPYGWLS